MHTLVVHTPFHPNLPWKLGTVPSLGPALAQARLPTVFSSVPLPPAHLKFSDGHDLLPSQFHLAQLWSGQLWQPVPALQRGTRHPTGPGSGSPEALMAPATCVKGRKMLEKPLLGSAGLCFPHIPLGSRENPHPSWTQPPKAAVFFGGKTSTLPASRRL